ncbi:MAG: acylphosphatase [Pirellulaceae bacterium]
MRRNVGMGTELRELWYAGHVQGVGFRYTALAVARRYDVSGYVRNLSDGRVYLVVEGQVDQLDAFLAALAGRMQDGIRDVRQDCRPATGQYSRFEIRS